MTTFIGRIAHFDTSALSLLDDPVVVAAGKFHLPYSVRSAASSGKYYNPNRRPTNWEEDALVYAYLMHTPDGWKFELNDRVDIPIHVVKSFINHKTDFNNNETDQNISAFVTPKRTQVTIVEGLVFTELDPAFCYVVPVGRYVRNNVQTNSPVRIRSIC